jgi:hypothetical protein
MKNHSQNIWSLGMQFDTVMYCKCMNSLLAEGILAS